MTAAENAPRLGLVELLDQGGAVAHRIPVTRWPVTIGRALDCDVVLDDPHAAAHHASLSADGSGTAMLQVGATRNGLRLGGRLVAAGGEIAVASGNEWQIGRTRMRLRLAGEALAEEVPLLVVPVVRKRWLLAGLALLVGWMLGQRWLESDPGDPLSGYLAALVGVPLGLGIWCFLWALGSKLFARHFDFLAHLRWALLITLASQVLEAMLPLAAFALSWEWLARSKELLVLALGCLLVYGHLRIVLPTRRQMFAVAFASVFIVGATLRMALNHQRTDRWFSPLYLSSLGPPALRLVPAVSPAQFLDEARALRAPLEKRARDTDAPAWLAVDTELD